MKRGYAILIILIQLSQLYVMYSFWQMDKRFVESTNMELSQDKEGTSYAL